MKYTDIITIMAQQNQEMNKIAAPKVDVKKILSFIKGKVAQSSGLKQALRNLIKGAPASTTKKAPRMALGPSAKKYKLYKLPNSRPVAEYRPHNYFGLPRLSPGLERPNITIKPVAEYRPHNYFGLPRLPPDFARQNITIKPVAQLMKGFAPRTAKGTIKAVAPSAIKPYRGLGL